MESIKTKASHQQQLNYQYFQMKPREVKQIEKELKLAVHGPLKYMPKRRIVRCLKCPAADGKHVEMETKALSAHFQRKHPQVYYSRMSGKQTKFIEDVDFSETGKTKTTVEKQYQCKTASQLIKEDLYKHHILNGPKNKIQQQRKYNQSYSSSQISSVADASKNAEIENEDNESDDMDIENKKEKAYKDYISELQTTLQFQSNLLGMLIKDNMFEGDYTRKPLKSIKKSQQQEQMIQIKRTPDIKISIDMPNFDNLDNKIIHFLEQSNYSKHQVELEILKSAISQANSSIKKIQELIYYTLNKIKQTKQIENQSINSAQNPNNSREVGREFEIWFNISAKFEECFELLEEGDDYNKKLFKQTKPLGINADLSDAASFSAIKKELIKYTGQKTDCLIIDFPWSINSLNKKGKKFINYDTMSTQQLYDLPIEKIQDRGLCFFWVVNSKRMEGYEFLRRKGYRVIDQIVWVKTSKRSRKISSGIGTYFRHCHEICLVGLKGDYPHKKCMRKINDTFAAKRGAKHSQKPDYIHRVAERMWPGGVYVELFGRKNNLRMRWITIGNEFG